MEQERDSSKKSSQLNYNPVTGINGRMDNIEEAMLNDAGFNSTPYIESTNNSAYAQYTIQAEKKNKIADNQVKVEILTGVLYPKLLHEQRAFLLGGNFPVSESVSIKVTSLHNHPYLPGHVQQKVVDALYSIQ